MTNQAVRTDIALRPRQGNLKQLYDKQGWAFHRQLEQYGLVSVLHGRFGVCWPHFRSQCGGPTGTSHRPYSCSARLCMCSTRRQCTQSRSRSSMCTTKRDGFSGKPFFAVQRRTRGSCSSPFLRINLLTLGPGLLSTTGKRFMLGLCIRGLGGFTWTRRRAAPPTKEDA